MACWRRPVPHLLITGLLVIGVLLLLALSRNRSDRAGIYTMIRYAPAICTQDLRSSACGDAVITVRTRKGELRTFRYSGDKPPKGERQLATLYARGATIEIITSGDDHAVVQVRHVAGPRVP